MSINGTFRAGVNLSNQKDDVDFSTPSENISQNIQKNITTGKLWHDQVTLSATQVYTIDVNDGSLEDVYGQPLTLSGVTGVYIKADSTNVGDFTVSGIAFSFLNDLPAFGASEGVCFACDIVVTTNSKLCIVNGLSAGLVDIIISGDE